MEYIREHKKGFIGTTVFHAVVLLLLILLRLFTVIPPPGEEGILVNFGTSENGLGLEEPSPAMSDPSQIEPAVKQQEEVAPPVVSQPKTQPKPAQVKESVMTQDYEKTAAVKAAENKKKAEDQKLKAAEQERIRKQLEEADRINKAEAEKIAKAETERKAREEEQRKINEINSRTQGAFASKGTGTGGKGTGTGTSQGATFPGGNQGVPTGDPNASNYGQGGLGSGNKGSGPSFSLDGRSASSLPKPNYPGDDEGIVVVKITVDKNGNVTSAEPGARGTTIMDQKFWAEAKQAAQKAKFNNAPNAPAYQQGTITYRFILD